MKSLTKVILVLLAVGQSGCANGGQTGSNGRAQPQGCLSAETRQRIEAYQRGRHPWQQVSPDVYLLRRQLFELRHRLIISGQEVETDTRQHGQVLKDLALEVSAPATHVCGQQLAIKITLHNRGPTPMRLLIWDDAFNVQVAHESGHIVREPPAVRAAIIVPRPKDYRTLAAGESFARELKLRHLPPNLPPGLYHVEIVYYTRAWGGQNDTVEGSAGSLVREVRFVLGREADGLRASLRLDESAGVDEHGAPVFLATLKDTADHDIMLMPWAGTLIFREVQTEQEIEFSQTIADPEGLPPRDPRGYPIRSSYQTLRPGEGVKLRIRPQATFDGQRTRYWRDVLVPGRRYEVRWHYHNDTGWFIEDGQFLQWSNVWMGRLGSAPLGFTLSEGQEVERKTAQTQPATRASSSYPYLTPEQRPQKAKEAVDPSTDEKTRFYAVWGLAISGYSRESAEALAIVAADSNYDVTTRGYAGMGLSNFSNAIPEDVRQAILDRLYGSLSAEKDTLPDGVMRTLIDWGEADRVRKVLGDKLRGHRMEIEVLQRISSRKEAIERLMELYKAAPDVTSNIGWTKRWHVGAALIERQDKQGIDILIECLTVKNPWPTEATSPQAIDSNARSFRQSLHNTFTRLATIFDDRFGYEAGGTWAPQLDDAIPQMVEWWKANRQSWSFAEAQSTDLPKLAKGKELTKRQARVLAAKLANDAFAKQEFKHANGEPVGEITIAPESFNDVEKKDGRWVLRIVRSRGPEAFVEFDADGLNQKVSVNYALR